MSARTAVTTAGTERCELGTIGDPPCERPVVVRIEDRSGGSRPACDLHGARALRAIDGARVSPLPGQAGAAIAVYLTARGEGRP